MKGVLPGVPSATREGHDSVVSKADRLRLLVEQERGLERADRRSGASDADLDLVLAALRGQRDGSEARYAVTDRWNLTAPLSEEVIAHFRS